jgi:hypothetical protein
MPAMDFFSFPTEIRLMIYSELLVHSRPIIIRIDDRAIYHVEKAEKRSLYLELLRVNKKMHSEASPVLYSKNRFGYPDSQRVSHHGHNAPSLRQIGSQTSLIRYICITFPRSAVLDEFFIKRLELIQDTCKCITTIELILRRSMSFYKDLFEDSPIGAEALDMLDMRFKTFPSLKKIFVTFKVRRVTHKVRNSASASAYRGLGGLATEQRSHACLPALIPVISLVMPRPLGAPRS